jgi:hypothetical protein
MARYLVFTDAASTDHVLRNKITKYLEERRFSVWHWLQDVWLLGNVPAALTPFELRRQLTEAVAPLRYIFVVRMQKGNFSAAVPKEGIPWLIENWKASTEPPND